MRLGNRVVCKEGDRKGKTGTIMQIKEQEKPYLVLFDDCTESELSIEQLCKIDDISDSGKVQFEVGMNIYDITFNMVGKIDKVMEFDSETKIFRINWENGEVSEIPLDENYNFIVK